MSVRDEYEGGCCPDCGETIPEFAQHGEACANCGHVWNAVTYYRTPQGQRYRHSEANGWESYFNEAWHFCHDPRTTHHHIELEIDNG